MNRRLLIVPDVAMFATMVLVVMATAAAVVVTTAEQQSLIDAGKLYPAAVVWSEKDPYLNQLAQGHADYMARWRRQGHQGWDGHNGRFRQILAKYGNVRTSEICAESWDQQRNDPLPEIGKEMYHSWEQSSGHWSVASKKHRLAGFGMARGRNGVYCACVIVVE